MEAKQQGPIRRKGRARRVQRVRKAERLIQSPSDGRDAGLERASYVRGYGRSMGANRADGLEDFGRDERELLATISRLLASVPRARLGKQDYYLAHRPVGQSAWVVRGPGALSGVNKTILGRLPGVAGVLWYVGVD